MRHFRIVRRAAVLMFSAPCLGCVDLDLVPPQDVAFEEYFRSMSDFRAAVTGLYDQLQTAGWYGRTLPLIADGMGEDVKLAGACCRYYGFNDFEGLVVTGHGHETQLWAKTYEGIMMANMVINASFEPPAAARVEFDQLVGEAYAVRALAYFDLVRMFAQHYTFTPDASHPGVPIVLDVDWEALPARNTVAEVYDRIITDFEAAIGLMRLTRAGPHMFTREAAQALLSRVYLYMDDFTASRAMADEVVNSGKFALVTGPAYVTQFADGGSAEAILEIEFTDTDNPGSDHVGGMYRASGYGDFLPAKDLLDRIDPGDIRAQMFILDPHLVGIYASMRVNKYPTSRGTDNVPVIRLSEVYLNRAEAAVRMGDDAAAQADLNLIRQRGLPAAPDVTAAGQGLLDEILLERRIELGYEGHRIFDITRHRLDVVRIDCTSDVCFYGYPGPYFILPIPLQEIDANPNIQQNPGYR